jgi:hypothetical protein
MMVHSLAIEGNNIKREGTATNSTVKTEAI